MGLGLGPGLGFALRCGLRCGLGCGLEVAGWVLSVAQVEQETIGRGVALAQPAEDLGG